MTSLSFLHNTSYVEVEPLNSRPNANVTITFATEQENGVLLYTGDSQHLGKKICLKKIVPVHVLKIIAVSFTRTRIVGQKI